MDGSGVGKWGATEENKKEAMNLMLAFGIPRECAEREVTYKSFWAAFAKFIWERVDPITVDLVGL